MKAKHLIALTFVLSLIVIVIVFWDEIMQFMSKNKAKLDTSEGVFVTDDNLKCAIASIDKNYVISSAKNGVNPSCEVAYIQMLIKVNHNPQFLITGLWDATTISAMQVISPMVTTENVTVNELKSFI
jgi:hypothetical protein